MFRPAHCSLYPLFSGKKEKISFLFFLSHCNSHKSEWRLLCWGNPSMDWKRTSRQRVFQKGVSLFRRKCRDNVGIVIAVGWPPDRPGKVDSFCGLIANFYSLKTKKIPAGRLALGDWLGCYSVLAEVGTCWSPLMDRDLAVRSWRWESERESQREGERERKKERHGEPSSDGAKVL